MESLPNKTFHLVYHDIGHHHNKFTRWIDSMVTPAAFEAHIKQLTEIGSICSLNESFDIDQGKDAPRFVIWFDDAYKGVYKYGSTICRQNKIVASLAVNSRFALQESCFWRCELSWLLETLTPAEIANNLFSSSQLTSAEIWSRTLDQYSPELHQRISDMFCTTIPAPESRSWQESFMNVAQLKELADHGWSLCNHSANHPAFVTPNALADFLFDFKSATGLMSELGGREDTWVIPFDYGQVKKTVESQLNQITPHCAQVFRAFYFPEKEANIKPRITIHGQQDVLTQIKHAISPQQKSGFQRLKSYFKRLGR